MGARKVLFVFVDGLGAGQDSTEVNPLADACRYPVLNGLLRSAVPIDAGLGVAGYPQSATGQTSLLTGRNAAQVMGRHVEGFPPSGLRGVIEENNIFLSLLSLGKTAAFANAYWLDDISCMPKRLHSVTTVASLAAFGGVRGKKDLLENRAVYHDLTREMLLERGYAGPVISPETAGEQLLKIAYEYDFTLFEFFETDRAGHSGDSRMISRILDKLERFLNVVSGFRGNFILTSDHGNIEDSGSSGHTLNPVPFYVSDSCCFPRVLSVEEVSPAIISYLEG